ncbi:hypothetical protein CEN50_17615 [Fischerella thermalis CCMEE 5268]|uniref:Uncharacterized protein n=1 Tax=Fischerella thermalis CCMEE 5268 TaxID=2019662 RepID=A0A2N6KD83_9CYAN|nr:hypothetical protein CEN50_17615 [Fischerella thermalis CCMEE 5268]
MFHERTLRKATFGDVYNFKKYDILYWHDCATHVSPSLLDLIDWLMARDVTQRPANTQEILQS